MRKPTTLRDHIEAMAPMVDELRELHRRATGLSKQWEGMGSDGERRGAEKFLGPIQVRLDETVRTLGIRIPDAQHAVYGRLADVLKAIETLAKLCDAQLNTVTIPWNGKVWTNDLALYVPANTFAGGVPRYRLATNPGRLAPDGSIAAPRRKATQRRSDRGG